MANKHVVEDILTKKSELWAQVSISCVREQDGETLLLEHPSLLCGKNDWLDKHLWILSGLKML